MRAAECGIPPRRFWGQTPRDTIVEVRGRERKEKREKKFWADNVALLASPWTDKKSLTGRDLYPDLWEGEPRENAWATKAHLFFTTMTAADSEAS